MSLLNISFTRWSKIAQHLPGRTDNEIKNYWRTRVQKQARQLKIDSNSNNFLEAIRMYWMPRLIEKMEQNSSSSSNMSSSPSSSSSFDNKKLAIPSHFILHDDPVPLFSQPNQPVTGNNNISNSSSANTNNIFSDIFTPPASCGKFLVCEKSIQNECYHVGNIPSYEYMREFEASQDFLFPDCHVAGSDWLFGEEFWNFTDDLWQFRKSGTEEIGGVCV